jgi:peroxiredoxin
MSMFRLPHVPPHVPITALLAILLTCSGQPGWATGVDNAPTAEEQEFWRAAGIDTANPVEYEDQNHKPISYAECRKLIRAGNAFSVDVREDKSVVLIKGKPANISIRIKPGTPFPEFGVLDLSGKKISKAQLLGRPTLINFYFAGCGPCLEEAPRLNQFFATRPDLNLLSITFDSAQEAKRFVRERHFTWPIVPNAMKLIKQVGVPVFPAFVLLGPDGKVLATDFPPRLDWELPELEQWLARAIPGKAR